METYKKILVSDENPLITGEYDTSCGKLFYDYVKQRWLDSHLEETEPEYYYMKITLKERKCHICDEIYTRASDHECPSNKLDSYINKNKKKSMKYYNVYFIGFIVIFTFCAAILLNAGITGRNIITLVFIVILYILGYCSRLKDEENEADKD